MSSIDEKRVYDSREGANICYLASGVGVVRVAVSGALVGEYGVVRQGATRDVAVVGGRLVVATDEDVVVDGEATGLGPACAVGTDAVGRALVVRDDGSVTRLDGAELGRVPDARAVDGGLVATPNGVYRVRADVSHAGLDDVRDVTGSGTGPPLAATADGLYALGPGWAERAAGAWHAVAGGPDGPVALDDEGRVHLSAGDVGGRAGRADGWERLPALPDDLAPVDCARGAGVTYVAGEGGRFAARVDGDGWRMRTLGTPGVNRLVVGESKGERGAAGSDRT